MATGEHRSSLRCCDICHAEEEPDDALVGCPEAEGACPRCSPRLRAHSDCLQMWHEALARPSSTCVRSSASCFGIAARARSRSTSSLTADLARRFRGAFANPRQRPSTVDGAKLQRSRSATASPSGMPAVVGTTASCGDLRRLEDVFEPRLAPYTPPLRLRSSSSTESFSGRRLSDVEISALEKMVFEPRDATCTPPLRCTRSRSAVLERQGESEKSECLLCVLCCAPLLSCRPSLSSLVSETRKTSKRSPAAAHRDHSQKRKRKPTGYVYTTTNGASDFGGCNLKKLQRFFEKSYTWVFYLDKRLPPPVLKLTAVSAWRFWRDGS